MTKTSSQKPRVAVVDRDAFIGALTRVRRVVPSRTYKPILEGVQLESADGEIRLRATDLDVSVLVRVPADGRLPACVVTCNELLGRVKACKASACTLRLDAKAETLVINGGRVDHSIHTLDSAEFPAPGPQQDGDKVYVAAAEFRQALSTALVATAKDPSRYALDSVLLEADDKGSRLAATDGRRLVIRDFEQVETVFQGEVLLPGRLAGLAVKLIDAKRDDPVVVFVKQYPDKKDEPQLADLFVAGPDWRLHSKSAEGRFPRYRDVIPKSGSKFVVDRRELLETLDAVALATREDSRGVRLDLSANSVQLSARAPEVGESSGQIPATFEGGSDDSIVTAFNPSLLRDAFRTLTGDRVVIDLQPNTHCKVGKAVMGKPAVLYDAESELTRWVVMPISIDLSAGKESVGDNSGSDNDSEPVATESVAKAPGTAGAPVKTDVSSGQASRRRRKVEHAWPAIGTRLDGQFEGETYAALVVAAPTLKSGRALQLISGPVIGQTFKTMTAAMVATTARQRRKLGLKGKKGLLATGWEFWQAPKPKRASA